MNRLSRLLRLSLLGRVALALALVGLLPVGVLAWRLIGLNRDAMETQVELTHTRAAGTIAKRVDAEIATFLALASGLAANPAFADPRSPEAQDLLRYNLGAWSQLGVMAIAVVTPQGDSVIMAQLPDEDSRRRVRATSSLPVGERVTLRLTDPSSAEMTIPDNQKIIDLRVAAALPEERGLVWLVVDGSELRDSVVDPEQLGEEARVTLAHRNGYAILGTLDPYPPEVLEYAFNPNVEGVESSFRTVDGDVIGAYAPVDHAPWTVLSRQQLDVAHATANEMRRESWLAVALVALVVFLLSGVAYVSVVRPIRQLAAAQRRLAGVGGAAAGNEIDQLRASFDALEERLKDREALDEVFLGRYQVRDVIGSGAMGTVFLGYDPKLQRPVALKTIRLDQKMPAEKRHELLTRLLQEAVTTAKFNHPNIVAIYDAEDRDDAAFMAMEFVDGDSLENLLWREGKLPVDGVIALGAAIASGLAAAHENRLVHRDVKPANILLGKNGSIKVTDFGIAELLSSLSEREDVVFGTPGYLPPETLQGRGYDASGDLFSLGSILYFCVTGRRPFEGKGVKEIIRKTLFGTVTPPSELEPAIGRDLEALIMGLLSNDRERRPRDARAIADRLERMAASRNARWQPPASGLERGPHEATAPAAEFLPTTRMAAPG